jgi:hypothetical protein
VPSAQITFRLSCSVRGDSVIGLVTSSGPGADGSRDYFAQLLNPTESENYPWKALTTFPSAGAVPTTESYPLGPKACTVGTWTMPLVVSGYNKTEPIYNGFYVGSCPSERTRPGGPGFAPDPGLLVALLMLLIAWCIDQARSPEPAPAPAPGFTPSYLFPSLP